MAGADAMVDIDEALSVAVCNLSLLDDVDEVGDSK